MTKSTGLRRRTALTGLIAATTLLAMLPASASAAAYAGLVNGIDGSTWSWPGMAQTFVAPGGTALTEVGLTLSRTSTDTGTYRVEVRTTSGGVPTGHQAASTGVVIAAQTLSATTLSTDSGSPTFVPVVFARPAVLTTQQTRRGRPDPRHEHRHHAGTPATRPGRDRTRTDRVLLRHRRLLDRHDERRPGRLHAQLRGRHLARVLHPPGERRGAQLTDARELLQLQGPVRQARVRPRGRRLHQERQRDGLHDPTPRSPTAPGRPGPCR